MRQKHRDCFYSRCFKANSARIFLFCDVNDPLFHFHYFVIAYSKIKLFSAQQHDVFMDIRLISFLLQWVCSVQVSSHLGTDENVCISGILVSM